MIELTDTMIETALRNSSMINDVDILPILLGIAIILFLALIFFVSKNTRQKVASGLMALLFLYLCLSGVIKQHSLKRSVEKGEWIVLKDRVVRVMEETHQNGSKDYYLVLKETGRASLNGQLDAMQYLPGDEIYVIVVPKGSGYERTGIKYSANVYVYVGTHY